MVVPPDEKDGDKKSGKLTEWHCFVGEIRYDMVDRRNEESAPNGENGIFVYLKASLTGDEPADVLNYQTVHNDFPHQTTADQWFTESQFESYRRLGLHITEKVFGEKVLKHRNQVGRLFHALKEEWGADKAKAVLKKQLAGGSAKEA